jgi:hypothetical protein
LHPQSDGWRDRLLPAVERRTRREAIGATEVNAVLARVLQDVDERIAHFARRFQSTSVVVIVEHRTAAMPQLIQSARDTDEQTLHRSRERAFVPSLDDQMHVIRLDGVLDQSNVEAIRSDLKPAPDQRELALAAQARRQRAVES